MVGLVGSPGQSCCRHRESEGSCDSLPTDVVNFRRNIPAIRRTMGITSPAHRQWSVTVEKIDRPYEALKMLASHLARRRDTILSEWRRAVDADPELMTASTITRAQFVDHIPAVLDAFEWRLSARDP